jgi:cbb3-type cytochrome oxidase subunit 1
MPKISKLFFKTAILFLLVGIAIGLKMSISGVHNVTGAHAHANLLGWVTMAIMGAYYALAPAKAEGRLAMVQYGVYTLGVLIMIPALYMLLLGNPQYEPLVAGGSLITFAGVILFAFIIFSGERQTAKA